MRHERDQRPLLQSRKGAKLRPLVASRISFATLRLCGRKSFPFLAAALLLCHFPSLAVAHDGPPFPIIVDQQVGPCIISVWTDPDIGEGSFFIITQPAPNSSIPSDLTVQLAVQPTSGRLSETTYTAVREDRSGQVMYQTMVQFDVQEMWRVRVKLQSAQGNGEAEAFVEPTPEGLGRWDLLIYLLPFVAIGFLWLRAFLSKRGQRKAPS